jgi:lipoprotein-anchoring transpeptidase ErfK/SrfK
VTDLAVKPGADDASTGATSVVDTSTDAPETSDETTATSPLEWSPAEPEPKKKRVGLWIGIGAGAALAGLVAASLVLIAPGTSVGGASVGFMTPGAATDALTQRLAETTVVLTGEGADAELTGADLGATLDARALADTAFAERPAWNVTQWFGEPLPAVVAIDDAAATEALRAIAPDLYVDPVDATLAFDAATASYITTPSVEGTGIDVSAVRDALQSAFVAGESRVEFNVVAAPIDANIPTYVAESAAANLNGILDHAGFYVGEERTVPIDRAVVASWLTVEPGERGTFEITADEAAIQQVVDTLPEIVNRAPVNNTVITDTAGEVLREESAGVVGRELGDPSQIAGDYAAQLATGNGAFTLPVTEVPFTTTALARNVVVDLSEQRVYLYENGNIVDSYLASTGKGGSPTFTGSFRVNWKTPMQDLGCFEGAPYCTENVPYLAYFNGDQALHGAYWHNNFGNVMSHGCVNLPVATAKFVYDWVAVGTEVRVQA